MSIRPLVRRITLRSPFAINLRDCMPVPSAEDTCIPRRRSTAIPSTFTLRDNRSSRVFP